MIKRIKQFYQQLLSKMKPEDHVFVQTYLSPQELLLFNRLSTLNQKHCVEVTYSLLTNYPNAPTYLIKAALLHDIGKSKGSQNIFIKVVSVLCFSVFPSYSLAYAKKHNQNFLYYYYFHPQLSAKMLTDIHSSHQIIHIVKNHHAPSNEFDILQLKKADELH